MKAVLRTVRFTSATALERSLAIGIALSLFLALTPSFSIAQKAKPTTQSGIVAHPDQLKYPTLVYTPPQRAKYRQVLANGVVTYMVEDHTLPLINVTVIVRTGDYLEPEGKDGLASLTGSQIRSGGTTTKKAEDFDEEADFLAAILSSGIGNTQGSANFNCLSKDIDKALALFFDMLKNPGFQEDRLKLAKTQILQAMERRNDDTEGIESREWERLMYGDNHFSTRLSTKASIESITRDDLLAFHKKYYNPANFIFAVSGDFNTAEMKAKLENAMRGWDAGREPVAQVPKPTHTPVPGLYVVNKPDVNQGRVTLGHLSTTRDNPDYYALAIMNDILGGGGFTSRIMGRVRSDEGLAYSAGSDFGFGTYYPTSFTASFQSKSSTTAQAIEIVLQEINRIRTEKIKPEELNTSINQFVETFSLNFSSAAQIAGTFAQDEYTGRAADFWEKYRERIKAVTADDILRVAQKYLQPDKLVILVVGNIDDIAKGDPDKPQYQLMKFAKEGKVTRIPLPDPLTMKYPQS
ncbi:MAG: pitrilysin family protein [Acidobacteriota bacterium]